MKVFKVFKLIYKPKLYHFVSSKYWPGVTTLLFLRSRKVSESKVADKFKEKILGDKSIDSRVYFFAAARMGFFHVLDSLNLKENDEVLLTGFSCSVMSTAALRSGAKIKYVDIDKRRFSTDWGSLQSNLSENTKVVIIQHSFGAISNCFEHIQRLQELGIIVVEDCAISICSSSKEGIIGTKGDFSIYSFDHSKPVNALLGGALVQNNLSIPLKTYDDLEGLTKQRISKIHKRMIFERLFNRGKFYNWGVLLNSILLKIGFSTPFLIEDVLIKEPSYPYPSKIPHINLALLDLMLEKIDFISEERKKNYKLLVGSFDGLDHAHRIQKLEQESVPLRLVLYIKNPQYLDCLNSLSKYIDTSSFWFKKPIVYTSKTENYMYVDGSCPNAEEIGNSIINIPLDLDTIEIYHLKSIISELFETPLSH